MQKNVLCVGHINLDEIIKLDKPLSEEKSCVAEQIKYTLGGGATNTAKILPTQNEIDNVFLAAPIAKDTTGEKLRTLLDEYDVELVVGPYDDIKSKRIRCLVSEDTEPQYIEEGGGIEKLNPDEIPVDIWESVDHIHQTSYMVQSKHKNLQTKHKRMIYPSHLIQHKAIMMKIFLKHVCKRTSYR